MGTELLTSMTGFIGIIAVKVAHHAIDISERECTEICGLTAEEDRKSWIYYVDSHRLVPHSTPFFRKSCVLYTLYTRHYIYTLPIFSDWINTVLTRSILMTSKDIC